MRSWKFPLFQGATAVVVAFLFGCSSSIFTGDKGSELDPLKGDGRFNKACLGMDLSQPELTVPVTRALFKCLNSNGSIQEYANLIESMSDTQLQSLITVINKQLITNVRRLKELDRSFTQMDERGVLDRTFSTLAKVLEKGRLIRAAVKIARQGTGYHDDDGVKHFDPSVLASIKILTQEVSGARVDGVNDVQYSTATARKNFARILDLGLQTAKLKSYDEAVKGLNSNIGLIDPRKNLEFSATRGLEYLQTKIRENDPLGKVMLWGIADGTLLKAFDYYYTQQCEHAKPSQCENAPKLDSDGQVQAMESFLRMLTVEHKETILGPMVDLFRVMDAPISCMAETKRVPNADMFIMSLFTEMPPLDVPDWTIRTNMIKLKLANSLCSFPQEDGPDGKTFGKLIGVLNDVASYEERNASGAVIDRHRPLVTVAHFSKGLEVGEALAPSEAARADLSAYSAYIEGERYRRFLINWLGDKNKTVNAYTHLADGLAELTRRERSVLGNVLYLLNVAAPESRDRRDLQTGLNVLMKLRSELADASGVPGSNPKKWRSLYDVASKSIMSVDSDTLVTLLTGVSELIDTDQKYVEPLLSAQREALLMNDANPGLEILLELGLDPRGHESFFTTLFDVADTKQFEDAMRLTARMAGNGTLKELLQGVLAIYRSTMNQYPGAPNPISVPDAPLADAARDKSSKHHNPWNPSPVKWPSSESGVASCFAMDLDMKTGTPFPTNDPFGAKWSVQMKNVGHCANANGDNNEVEALIERYSSLKDSRGNDISIHGKPFLAWLTDKAAQFIPAGASEERVKAIYDELTDLMIDPVTFAQQKNLNQLLPFVFGKQYCSKFDKDLNPSCSVEKVTLAQALERALYAISGKEEAGKLQEVLNLAASVVNDRKVTKTIAMVYDASQDADKNETPIKADEKPPLVSYPINNYPDNRNLEQWMMDSIRKYEKREPTPQILAEKAAEYWREPLNGEQKHYVSNGKQRVGYKDAADFKASIKPLFDELSKGTRLDWMLAFFFYLDRNPYTPEWWGSWFRRAANNVRPMPYYYPGTDPAKDKPTVRYINQLDLLELVVIDADFTLKEVGQGATGWLFSDINDVFAIRYLTHLAQSGADMNPAIDAMKRELDFYNSLRDGVGFLLKPEVRRRLFNLTQVFPILREMNKVASYKQPDGSIIYANDLGVLRDLFKAVLSATAPKHSDCDRKQRDDCYTYRRETNSLVVVTKLVKFGLMKNIGSSMWYKNPNRDLNTRLHEDDDDGYHRQIVPQKTSNVMRFLLEAAITHEGDKRKLNKDALAAVGYLLRDDCKRDLPQYKGKSCVSNSVDPKEKFDDRYVLLGKLLTQFFEWLEGDDAREDRGEIAVKNIAKRAGFEAMLLLDRIGYDANGSRSTANLTKKLVAVLNAALGNKVGSEMLGDNLDIMESLLTESKGIHMMEILRANEFSDQQNGDDEYRYTDRQAFNDARGLIVNVLGQLAYNDAQVTRSGVALADKVYEDGNIKAASAVAKWIDKDPEYIAAKKRYELDEIVGQVMHWLPKEPNATHPRQLRPRLMEFMSQHLSSGVTRDLLTYVGSQSGGANKDVFNNATKFIGEPAYVMKLNDFLDLMAQGIKDVYKAPGGQPRPR